MDYLNSKNILYMIVLFLIMVVTFSYALTYESSKTLYTNINGYELEK